MINQLKQHVSKTSCPYNLGEKPTLEIEQEGKLMYIDFEIDEDGFTYVNECYAQSESNPDEINHLNKSEVKDVLDEWISWSYENVN